MAWRLLAALTLLIWGSAAWADDAASTNAATALRSFGDFTLPVNRPFAIEMHGEIDDTTSANFVRALEARPGASILILDSPGGYVDEALVVANLVFERGMSTVVPDGSTCFSACAYIFFAGTQREAVGALGVHQIATRIQDLVFAQNQLSDVLDALHTYGVQQTIVSHMLRTPPQQMYVFSAAELATWEINRGGHVQLADASADVAAYVQPDPAPVAAYVHLAQFASRAEAERSLEGAKSRWTGLLGDAAPIIEPVSRATGESYRISVPARSLDGANALCDAIKSAGGGCYVSAL